MFKDNKNQQTLVTSSMNIVKINVLITCLLCVSLTGRAQDRINIYQRRMDSLEVQGNYEAACLIQFQLAEIKKIENEKTVNAYYDGLVETFNLDKIILRIKQELWLQNFLLSILFLILPIALICSHYSLRYKKENRILNEQANSGNDLECKLKLFKKKNENNDSVDMFSRIETLMSEEKLYLNPNLTREILADQLQTNRTYLIDTIRMNTGLVFSDYVNEHRLNHARALLMQRPDLNIQEIYQNTGFRSRTTFLRVFSKRFNMTPTEFRNLYV